jgi:hypothetical protein
MNRTVNLDPTQARDQYFQPGNQSADYRTQLDNTDFVDHRGLHYMFMPDGSVKYTSPAAYNQPWNNTGDATFFSSPVFNNDTGNVDRETNWGNIASLAAAGLLTGGAASALLSGGAAAGGAASGTLPATFTGASAPIATLPAAGAGLGTASAAGGAAAASAPAATGMLAHAAPYLKTAVPLIAGMFGQHGQGQSPESQQFIAEALRRMLAQGPLFDQMNRTVMSRMPGGR